MTRSNQIKALAKLIQNRIEYEGEIIWEYIRIQPKIIIMYQEGKIINMLRGGGIGYARREVSFAGILRGDR